MYYLTAITTFNFVVCISLKNLSWAERNIENTGSIQICLMTTYVGYTVVGSEACEVKQRFLYQKTLFEYKYYHSKSYWCWLLLFLIITTATDQSGQRCNAGFVWLVRTGRQVGGIQYKVQVQCMHTGYWSLHLKQGNSLGNLF